MPEAAPLALGPLGGVVKAGAVGVVGPTCMAVIGGTEFALAVLSPSHNPQPTPAKSNSADQAMKEAGFIDCLFYGYLFPAQA